MNKELLALLTLNRMKGIGPVIIRNLVAYCGSAAAVLEMPKNKLIKIPGIGEKTTSLLSHAEALQALSEKEWAYCEKEGIEILSFMDKNYPEYLKSIYDAPVVLFKKGKVRLNDYPGIAIVGTRKPTEYGIEHATFFAPYFSERGINVISGLAYGIDITAHKSVLQAGGITTGVVGHGLDIVYPGPHTEKARQMLERGGLVSEFFSGTKPDFNNFPARNRIIAGMSKAVIVIEGAETGGALITAHFAFEQNREVYALPGNIDRPYSKGCNKLIRDNVAKLITHPQEVLDDLGIYKEAASANPPLTLSLGLWNDDEIKVIHVLDKRPLHIDEIVSLTNISISELNVILLNLEFSGIVAQAPGKVFKLIQKLT